MNAWRKDDESLSCLLLTDPDRGISFVRRLPAPTNGSVPSCPIACRRQRQGCAVAMYVVMMMMIDWDALQCDRLERRESVQQV